MTTQQQNPEGDRAAGPAGLKAKLGLDVFKDNPDFHISIRVGREHADAVRRLTLICPAGLYSRDADGGIQISVDGCLECGACRIAAGVENLDWHYPVGGAGVQYRFG